MKFFICAVLLAVGVMGDELVREKRGLVGGVGLVGGAPLLASQTIGLRSSPLLSGHGVGLVGSPLLAGRSVGLVGSPLLAGRSVGLVGSPLLAGRSVGLVGSPLLASPAIGHGVVAAPAAISSQNIIRAPIQSVPIVRSVAAPAVIGASPLIAGHGIGLGASPLIAGHGLGLIG